MGIMDAIRKLFAKTNDVSAGLFSCNSAGACKACEGSGVIELNLSFMDKTDVLCEECQGSRYDAKVLSYKYKNKNIVEVTKMTIEEAAEFFESKEIVVILKNMIAVGLGYMSLGQSLTHNLSG